MWRAILFVTVLLMSNTKFGLLGGAAQDSEPKQMPPGTEGPDPAQQRERELMERFLRQQEAERDAAATWHFRL